MQAFIGQKYGEEVLPISIFAEEFDVIRAALEVHKGRDTRNSALLDQWYVRDDNNIPPVYVLKQTDEQLFEDCTVPGSFAYHPGTFLLLLRVLSNTKGYLAGGKDE